LTWVTDVVAEGAEKGDSRGRDVEVREEPHATADVR
jgi:hypothetical protein